MEIINFISSIQGFLWLIGGFIFLLFFIIILVVNISFAFSPDQQTERKKNVFNVILLTLFLGWISMLFVPGFFDVAQIKLEDGRWTLKNGLRIPVGSLTYDIPRRVELYSRKVISSGAGIAQFTTYNVYIITDKKVYKSWFVSYSEAGAIQKQLKQSMEKNSIPLSSREYSPIRQQQIFQKIRYGILIMLGSLIFIPEIVKKLKKKNIIVVESKQEDVV